MAVSHTDPMARAAAYVEKAVADVRSAERMWLDYPGSAYAARAFFNAARNDIFKPDTVPPYEMPDEVHRQFQIAIKWMPPAMRQELAMFTMAFQTRVLWSRLRVLYTLDPTLWNELKTIELDTKLPHDLFLKLPHPDPFIYFPEPILIPMGKGGEVQRIHGVFIHGRRGIKVSLPRNVGFDVQTMHCSTTLENCLGLSLSFPGYVEYADGSPVMLDKNQDVCWTHTSLLPADGGTLGEMIDEAIKRFHTSKVEGHAMSSAAESVPVLCTQAVSALIYLCCRNADLRPLPAGRRRSQTNLKDRPKPPRNIAVGFRVGAELRAYHRKVRSGEVVHTGLKTAPHVRRAHPHTFRCGPGRKETVMYWLHPILVNITQEAQVTTAIKVKSQRPRPEKKTLKKV